MVTNIVESNHSGTAPQIDTNFNTKVDHNIEIITCDSPIADAAPVIVHNIDDTEKSLSGSESLRQEPIVGNDNDSSLLPGASTPNQRLCRRMRKKSRNKQDANGNNNNDITTTAIDGNIDKQNKLPTPSNIDPVLTDKDPSDKSDCSSVDDTVQNKLAENNEESLRYDLCSVVVLSVS